MREGALAVRAVLELALQTAEGPYPGWPRFTEADAEHFFGRQGEIAAVRERLAQRRVLALSDGRRRGLNVPQRSTQLFE